MPLRTLLAVLLLGPLLLHSAAGVTYVNDELLWTKQAWPDYKLDFPWKHFAKREPAVAELLESEAWVKTSLSGPLGNIQAEIEKDLKRPTDSDSQPSRFDVSLLDDSASLEAAAGVAQCKVCMSLASLLWRGLTAWVNVHEAVPSKKRIAIYAEELCEHEVPNEVLAEWVLLRARVQTTHAAPFYIEGNQEFYMLSQRQKQHATPAEIAAVRLACKKMIKDDDAAVSKLEVIRAASGLLHKYFDHMEKRLGKASRTGAPVEAVDYGPRVDSTCTDRHPQCDKWAELGECKANPTYMVGDDKKYIGQCNKACGDCQPSSDGQPEWNDADIEHLATVSQDLLALLHSKACVGGPACASAAGAGMENLLSLAGGKLTFGGMVSGPVSPRAAAARPAVDPQRMQISRVMKTQPISEALISHKPPKKTRSSPPAKLPSATAKALWAELGNKCMYTPTGWWTYEVCFMDSVTQFHMTDQHQVDWVISLGKFESADWELRNTSAAALYPKGVEVPYVSLHFTQGNDCELTEDTLEEDEDEDASQGWRRKHGRPGSGGGGGRGKGQQQQAAGAGAEEEQEREAGQGGGGGAEGAGEAAGAVPVIKRVSQMRVMCSPDKETRVYVLEPRQCRYRVELYVPSLCQQEGFAVEWEAPGDAQAQAQAQEEEPLKITIRL